MLICTEAWSLAVMRRFVAALAMSQRSTSLDRTRRQVPFAGDVEVDNFSLIVFHDAWLTDRLSKLTPELKLRL
jgi:hypothetical protein